MPTAAETAAFQKAYGTRRGQPGYVSKYDYDRSGTIDVVDFQRFQSQPTPVPTPPPPRQAPTLEPIPQRTTTRTTYTPRTRTTTTRRTTTPRTTTRARTTRTRTRTRTPITGMKPRAPKPTPITGMKPRAPKPTPKPKTTTKKTSPAGSLAAFTTITRQQAEYTQQMTKATQQVEKTTRQMSRALPTTTTRKRTTKRTRAREPTTPRAPPSIPLGDPRAPALEPTPRELTWVWRETRTDPRTGRRTTTGLTTTRPSGREIAPRERDLQYVITPAKEPRPSLRVTPFALTSSIGEQAKYVREFSKEVTPKTTTVTKEFPSVTRVVKPAPSVFRGGRTVEGFEKAYWSKRGDPNYDPRYDYNSDGVIDTYDFQKLQGDLPTQVQRRVIEQKTGEKLELEPGRGVTITKIETTRTRAPYRDPDTGKHVGMADYQTTSYTILPDPEPEETRPKSVTDTLYGAISGWEKETQAKTITRMREGRGSPMDLIRTTRGAEAGKFGAGIVASGEATVYGVTHLVAKGVTLAGVKDFDQAVAKVVPAPPITVSGAVMGTAIGKAGEALGVTGAPPDYFGQLAERGPSYAVGSIVGDILVSKGVSKGAKAITKGGKKVTTAISKKIPVSVKDPVSKYVTTPLKHGTKTYVTDPLKRGVSKYTKPVTDWADEVQNVTAQKLWRPLERRLIGEADATVPVLKPTETAFRTGPSGLSFERTWASTPELTKGVGKYGYWGTRAAKQIKPGITTASQYADEVIGAGLPGGAKAHLAAESFAWEAGLAPRTSQFAVTRVPLSAAEQAAMAASKAALPVVTISKTGGLFGRSWKVEESPGYPLTVKGPSAKITTHLKRDVGVPTTTPFERSSYFAGRPSTDIGAFAVPEEFVRATGTTHVPTVAQATKILGVDTARRVGGMKPLDFTKPPTTFPTRPLTMDYVKYARGGGLLSETVSKSVTRTTPTLPKQITDMVKTTTATPSLAGTVTQVASPWRWAGSPYPGTEAKGQWSQITRTPVIEYPDLKPIVEMPPYPGERRVTVTQRRVRPTPVTLSPDKVPIIVPSRGYPAFKRTVKREPTPPPINVEFLSRSLERAATVPPIPLPKFAEPTVRQVGRKRRGKRKLRPTLGVGVTYKVTGLPTDVREYIPSFAGTAVLPGKRTRVKQIIDVEVPTVVTPSVDQFIRTSIQFDTRKVTKVKERRRQKTVTLPRLERTGLERIGVPDALKFTTGVTTTTKKREITVPKIIPKIVPGAPQVTYPKITVIQGEETRRRSTIKRVPVTVTKKEPFQWTVLRITPIVKQPPYQPPIRPPPVIIEPPPSPPPGFPPLFPFITDGVVGARRRGGGPGAWFYKKHPLPDVTKFFGPPKPIIKRSRRRPKRRKRRRR